MPVITKMMEFSREKYEWDKGTTSQAPRPTWEVTCQLGNLTRGPPTCAASGHPLSPTEGALMGFICLEGYIHDWGTGEEKFNGSQRELLMAVSRGQNCAAQDGSR